MLNTSDIDIRDQLCTGSRLSELLTFHPDSTVSADTVAETICSVDSNNVAEMLEYLLSELSIGKIVQQVGDNKVYFL